MLLTKSGHQPIYSAPLYAIPMPTAIQSTSSQERLKSLPILYSGTKDKLATRYGSVYAPFTDPFLVAPNLSPLKLQGKGLNSPMGPPYISKVGLSIIFNH